MTRCAAVALVVTGVVLLAGCGGGKTKTAPGRTLYVFERDRGRRSTCYRSCAQLWPPFTTTTDTRPASNGILTRLLGASQRTDRSDNVTYAGHPLSFYGFDEGPGDMRGQGVRDFGGRWWAISPSGRVLRGSGSS
jgi:predicted lipoprotein with Yx(FWY)xxD motif